MSCENKSISSNITCCRKLWKPVRMTKIITNSFQSLSFFRYTLNLHKSWQEDLINLNESLKVKSIESPLFSGLYSLRGGNEHQTCLVMCYITFVVVGFFGGGFWISFVDALGTVGEPKRQNINQVLLHLNHSDHHARHQQSQHHVPIW